MGIQKDVLVWSAADLSATPTLGQTFTVTGTPDLMAFRDDEAGTFPADFDPAIPNSVEPNQTLSGTLDGVEYTGDTATDDVFEFEVAFQVSDGTNTFNIYRIDNDQFGGTTVAYVSEVALDPGATYTVLQVDDSVNFDNGTGYETTPVWDDLAGQVDGTSGDDVIGAGYVDDDDDRVDGNDGDNDYIVGEGGGDTILSGAGDDVVYGDHVDDLPVGTTEYIAQGFVRDVNFELESGGFNNGDASFSVSGAPLEIRFVDNDGVLNGDTISNEAPDDTDQLVEINGVFYNYSADFVLQFNGSDGQVYDMLVLDVDRDSSGDFVDYDPTADPGDVDYEDGQILIPRGHVPPPGVTLTAFGPTYDLVNEGYSALNGAAVVTNYDDSIDAGSGHDTVFGGQGDDTLDGGTGNDTLDGGTGSDTFLLGDGYGGDSITGGEDISNTDVDVIDASGVTNDGVDVFLSGNESGSVTSTEGTANFVEIEAFALTDQDDTFDGGNSNNGVSVDGGAGNDSLEGGSGDDTLIGGAGDDVLIAGNNTGAGDLLFGGAGNDTLVDSFWNATLDGGDDADLFQLGTGDATVIGGDGGTNFDTMSFILGDDAQDAVTITFSIGGPEDGVYSDLDNDEGTFTGIEAFELTNFNDTFDATNTSQDVDVSGGAGDDQITGGSGDDTIEGGTGDDTIEGGTGADTLTGGTGADAFIVDGGGDIITDFDTGNGIGNGDTTDNDYVDLTQFYNETTLADWNAANPGNPYNTALAWLRADQEDGTLDQAGGLQVQNGGAAVAANELNAENTGVVCFTKGTLIATARGEVPVENLVAGDLVQTMDHGLQPIRWIGFRHLSETDLVENPKLQPIRISPTVMGLPEHERGLVVSPQHRILVSSKIAQRMLGDSDVLIAANKMLELEGVQVVSDASGVTYYHVLCDEHEILFANGIPAESLYLGDQALKSLSPEGLEEIRALFPELIAGHEAPRACRKIVSGSRTRTLCRRHAQNHKPLREYAVS